MSGDKLIDIKNLKISFPYNNVYKEVIRGVDLTLYKNDILGILGESGSGKTVTANSMLGLTKYDGGRVDSGEIIFNDMDILKLKEKDLRNIRAKEISYVFQNPVAALNPLRKIGSQLVEIQRVQKVKVDKQVILDTLDALGLENPKLIYEMYPSQLSGGQCQRIAIAMALIGKAKIMIADEPTSAIDASMQEIALELLRNVNERFQVSIIVITHDFHVVKKLCNKAVIMYGGLVMEKGDAQAVITNPKHPYTKALIECAKSMSNNDKTLFTLEGMAPTPQEFKNECPFFSRCPLGNEKCTKGIPGLKTDSDGRELRCVMV